ncbi:MAG: hypothetical protein H0T76_11380 [Nannocystis sp.]|nr:hypothetical protein [Nannocystis sp.]MBA3547076.1 hypothetical protein [Nannocystis sp.]
MIRRRRLIITPGPGRQLPDPEDPSLPQVSPHQPEPAAPLPPPAPSPAPAPLEDPGSDPDDRRESTSAAWLRGLGVHADPDARRAWLEPHLWAVLRARVHATSAEQAARWTQGPCR